MELVSLKVEYAPLSPSTRVERRDPSDPPPPLRPRWNAGSSKGKSPGVLSGGNSLLSLKSYYRKLRTFKGTIKALINLRRFSGGKKTDGTILEELVTPANDPRRATKAVARITADSASLDTVQGQVYSLVNDGHVITEIDRSAAKDVSYRQQGNLEHYTEKNLMKRIAMQRHPHLVALTQRLWLCAVQTGSSSNSNAGSDSSLKFANYEAFMLRLHRLILPEFDVAASRELIQDDWARDTSGKNYLDYSFFHLSMFELVDLWTDTVDEEDYISLLYCIMHSLTFAWGDRHLLKPLEDINPVDILEESKGVTAEQIAAELKFELESAEAGSFLDQIIGSTPQEHHDHVCTDENGEAQRLTTESEASKLQSGSEPTNRLAEPRGDGESGANGTVAAASASVSNATAKLSVSDSNQATSARGERARAGNAAADIETGGVGGTDSTSDRRRLSGNRAQGATSTATRRTSAFKRHTATNSKPRVFTSSSAGFNPHVIYDAAGLAVDQQSASPLMVKAYGQQQLDAAREFQRDRGLSISFDGDFRRNTGSIQLDGLHGSALAPMFAASRPTGLVADRSAAFLSGRELPHGFGIYSSIAAAGAKADSTRVASFTFEASSPRPPPLQVASLGTYDPINHVAVKPTTYILDPSPESVRTPRPQTSGSHVAASPTSPRAASASYKRARQPSAASTAHRPGAPPSLVASSSPRSKLNVFDIEISAAGLQPSHASPIGSPRQPGDDPNTSASLSLDPMLVTGKAATPRSPSKASIGAMYAVLSRRPTSPRAAHGGSGGVGDLTSMPLETQHHQHERKPSSEQRAPTPLDRVIRNQTTSAVNASVRSVSMAKLRHASSRRVPTGSRPGSSRLPAATSDAAALNVQSLPISPRSPPSCHSDEIHH